MEINPRANGAVVMPLLTPEEIHSPTLLLATLVVVIFLSVKWILQQRNSKVNRLPGPRPLFLIGNALNIKGGYDGSLETIHITWPQKYGEIYRWFVGSQCNVSLSSPELIEPILSSNTILDKGVDYEWYRHWLGDGLLISKGQKWKSRRRLLTPAFHFQILDDFIDVYNNQSRILCDLLGQLGRQSSADESERTVDVYPLLTRCTLDIICETAMGTRINAQTSREDGEYANSVHRMTQIIAERTTKPWLANNFLFPFTSLGREQKQLLDTLHRFTDNVIRRRRKQLNSADDNVERKLEETDTPRKQRKSLLDLLIQMSDDVQNDLTDRDLREEIDTFAFGGHDTTSAAMSWFLYCMASYPEHQERVWEELQDHFGDSDRDCSKEDLSHMKFMECCIKEALRLYPSAPLIERMSTRDIQIGEHTIPAGCNILILIYGMHRNPRLFNDPSVFNPERFFHQQTIGRHPYAYIPFSAGSRNCIGQRFAMMEEKVVLSTLLRRFKFSLSSTAEPPVPSYQVVLKPLNGLHLIVTRRCADSFASC